MQDYQPYSTTATASQLWPQNYRSPEQHDEVNGRGQYVSEWFPSPSLPTSIQYSNFAQLYNSQGYGTIRRARELYRRLYERNATLSRTVMVFQLDGGLQQGSPSSAVTTYYLASAVPIHLTQKPRNWRKDYRSPSSKVGGLRRHLDKLRLLFTRTYIIFVDLVFLYPYVMCLRTCVRSYPQFTHILSNISVNICDI